MASEADVRELALALPGTIEKSSYGTPGFRVRDKLFTTPHYDGYANVLVRLEAVDREELTELLAESARVRGG